MICLSDKYQKYKSVELGDQLMWPVLSRIFNSDNFEEAQEERACQDDVLCPHIWPRLREVFTTSVQLLQMLHVFLLFCKYIAWWGPIHFSPLKIGRLKYFKIGRLNYFKIGRLKYFRLAGYKTAIILKSVCVCILNFL